MVPSFISSSASVRTKTRIMARSVPSIQVPVLNNIQVPSMPRPTTHRMRTRDRSGSLVKVEEVQDRSVEDVLDRSAYVNINANWVNAKGV